MTVSMDLAGLLASPRWQTAVTVRAGTALDRPVADVVAVLDLNSLPAMSAHAVIAVISDPKQPDWRLDALLRRLVDGGATALLLPASVSLTETTIRLANRLAMVVLSTDEDVLTLVVEARQLLTKPDLVAAALIRSVVREIGRALVNPDTLVERLGALFGLPVAVLDCDGVPLAGEVGVPVVSALASTRQHLEASDRDLLLAPACDAQGRRAQLWVAVRIPKAAAWRTPALTDALDVAALALHRWALARRLEVERDARHRAALLGELLTLTSEPRVETRRRAADLGWGLDGWHVGVRIGVSPGTDVLGCTDNVMAAFRTEHLDPVLIEYGDGWSGWFTRPQEPSSDHVRRLSEAIRRAQQGIRGWLDTYVGVGRPQAGPAGIARTLDEAQDAARLAAGRPESGRFLHVDSLGTSQLLLGWTRTDTFVPAAHALLAALRDQPGDLVRTLGTFLDAESSIIETAAILGLHRNTVATRIGRIKDLLGVDLHDRDERLALHLACRTVLLEQP